MGVAMHFPTTSPRTPRPRTAADASTIHGGRSRRIALLLSMGCVIGAAGCQKVLFPESEPRNQFERSDNLRDRFTPVTEPDVFGNPKPALRARLAPSTT